MILENIDFSLLERLGGWAAVLVVTRWMMSQMSRMIDNLDASIKAMNSAIEQFKTFQKTEAEEHKQLILTQREILHAIQSLNHSDKL